jgi:hypothetical protein
MTWSLLKRASSVRWIPGKMDDGLVKYTYGKRNMRSVAWSPRTRDPPTCADWRQRGGRCYRPIFSLAQTAVGHWLSPGVGVGLVFGNTYVSPKTSNVAVGRLHREPCSYGTCCSTCMMMTAVAVRYSICGAGDRICIKSAAHSQSQ